MPADLVEELTTTDTAADESERRERSRHWRKCLPDLAEDLLGSPALGTGRAGGHSLIGHECPETRRNPAKLGGTPDDANTGPSAVIACLAGASVVPAEH